MRGGRLREVVTKGGSTVYSIVENESFLFFVFFFNYLQRNLNIELVQAHFITNKYITVLMLLILLIVLN